MFDTTYINGTFGRLVDSGGVRHSSAVFREGIKSQTMHTCNPVLFHFTDNSLSLTVQSHQSTSELY